MKAIGYIRRSKASDDRTISLLEQQRQVEDYCSRLGHEVAGTVVHDGVSGAKRARWDDIYRLLAETGSKVLVVYNQDRLARDGAGLMDNLTRISLELGIEVHEVGTGLMDIRKATAKFAIAVRGATDEFYRDLIREKTTDALRYKKSRNMRYNYKAPLGYRHVEVGSDSKGKPLFSLEKDPEEQRALVLIQECGEKGLGAIRTVEVVRSTGYEGRLSICTVHRILKRIRKGAKAIEN